MCFIVADNLREVAAGGARERMTVVPRQVRKQLVERVAGYALACEYLQLTRIADNAMNEMKRPCDARPKTLSQLSLIRVTKLGPDPAAGTCLLLRASARSHIGVGPPGVSGQGLLGDVTNGPKADPNLDVPTDDAIRLGAHGKQIHLASAVLDAANREEAFSIQPLLYQTFSE